MAVKIFKNLPYSWCEMKRSPLYETVKLKENSFFFSTIDNKIMSRIMSVCFNCEPQNSDNDYERLRIELSFNEQCELVHSFIYLFLHSAFCRIQYNEYVSPIFVRCEYGPMV